MPGSVSTGMDDHVWVQLPVQQNLSQYITSHPGQLNLAIPPRVATMSTNDGSCHC